MENISRVVVVGGGKLGKAVGMVVGRREASVDLWDANPAVVPGQKPLETLVPGADCVMLCVPSWAMRAAVTSVLPHLAPGVLVVSFAKGIEKDTLQTMAEMVPSLLPPGQPFAVVGGPMLAAEIAAGTAAIGVFASKDPAALAKMTALFSDERFRVEISADPASVALAGVLKNIYAVMLGIADGLMLSGNQKGWLVARATVEMPAIAAALGMDPEVMLGTAGMGDLVATGYSVYSRNRETGMEIVTTGTCSIQGEGLTSLPSLIARLGKEKAAAFPLMMLVNTIGIDCKPARQMFEAFFKDAGR